MIVSPAIRRAELFGITAKRRATKKLSFFFDQTGCFIGQRVG